MGAPSQAEILAAVGGKATLPDTAPVEELEVEEEEVESTDATEGVTDTEGVEQEDTDTEADTDTQEDVEDTEEEPDDEGQFLDYTLSGEALRVDLRNPDDIARVKKALEKEGLEATAQRHAEGRKQAEQALEAARVKVQEYEMMEEQRKPLDPYMKVLENPQARQRIAQQFRLPQVDYDPRLAEERVENVRLRAEKAAADNQQAMVELGTSIAEETGMDDSQLRMCVEYLNGKNLGWDEARSIADQGDSIRGLIGMAQQALMTEGKLPNPAVEKLEKEKADADRKLRSARKRAKARKPTAGTGAIGAQTGKPKTDLAGADISTVVAEYKRRTKKPGK